MQFRETHGGGRGRGEVGKGGGREGSFCFVPEAQDENGMNLKKAVDTVIKPSAWETDEGTFPSYGEIEVEGGG